MGLALQPAMRSRHPLLIALAVVALAGCVEDDMHDVDDAGEADGPLGGKADGLTDGEFFGSDTFYMFQIKGWDRTRMANDRLADKVCAGDPGLEFATLVVARADASSNTHCPSFAAEDIIFETAEFCMRTSGNLTKGTPKSSYALELDDDDNRLAGMKEINLKSMWNDVSQMRESIAWSMFNEAHIPAQRHTYAKLCMDPRGSDAPNVYRGLYSVIEEVDKPFLKTRFGKNDDGNLYKANWADIGPATLAFRGDNGEDYFTADDIGDRTYELDTNEDDDDPTEFQTYDDLARLIAVIDGRGLAGGDERFDTAAYRESVEGIFDARGFLRWAALNILMGAWDNYWRTPGNYYLYNSGRAGDSDGFMGAPYFYWLPHDYDNTFGIDFFRKDWQRVDILDWEGATAGAFEAGTNKEADLPLIRNLLRNSEFKAYYLDFMEFALDEIFTEEFVLEHIGDDGTGGAWDRVRASAFLEADGARLAPHTGRQFTNDQVFWNGFRQIQLPDVPVSQLRPGEQFTLGIVHHVRIRVTSARAQLAKLRETIPRGSSGASFPEAMTPVPK
jgi:hypothetical protein